MRYSEKPFYPSVCKVAEYICQEIKNNVKSPEVGQIKALLNFQQYIRPMKIITTPGMALVWASTSLSIRRLEAYKKWVSLVAKDNKWDHKSHILKEMGGEWHCDRSTFKKFNYDIWSNIHYGFVGRYAGFTTIELTSGGGFAQLKDNKMSFKEWAAQYASNFWDGGIIGAFDDPDDTHAVQVGYSLYEQFGDNPEELSAEAVLTELYHYYKNNQSLKIEECDMQCKGCRNIYFCNPYKLC